jgi:polysaccharide biosynthesis/export protein
MRKLTGLFLLLASAGLASPLGGQQTESLLIGRGDILHILVFDTPELEQHVRVTDAGTITLVMGGTVGVSGRTPTQAAQVVEAALISGRLMVKPRVSVTVEEYATQAATVLGEVKSPGFYLIDTPRSVIEVLAMAGGLTDIADRRILIERSGTHEKISYFLSNDPSIAAQTAVDIHPGDSVIVPKAGIVYVLGDVARPGGYVTNDNDGKVSVLSLVARAGGTAHSAVPARAKLIHKTEDGYETTPLPLSDIQKGKRPDVTLSPNDVVYVPFSYLRNIATQGGGIASSVAGAAIYR